MATSWVGGGPSKPKLRLNGKKIIMKDNRVLNLSDEFTQPMSYREEVIYHFDTEEQAKEYYYKKR